MNISIPDALRERMKAFDDEVNWSAIAAEAFAQACSREEHLAKIDDPVKQRLERTEMEDFEGFEAEGIEAGTYWAQHHARKIHLKRLAALHEAETADWSEASPHYVAGIALNDHAAVWEHLPAAPDLPDEGALAMGWLGGFVQGAVNVYHAL